MTNEVLALGLLTLKKWDRATDGKPADYVPTPDCLAAKDHFTATDLSDLRNTAARDIADVSPGGWAEWWWGVAASLVASFIWAMLLFSAGLIALYQSGGDMGELVHRMMAPTLPR
jgi:hypothetical protein